MNKIIGALVFCATLAFVAYRPDMWKFGILALIIYGVFVD